MSPFEQEVLVNIVGSFKSVVESKKNDIHSISKKEKAWNEIVKQFCAIAGVIKRDRDQLNKNWQNLKARAKPNISQEKREHEQEEDANLKMLMQLQRGWPACYPHRCIPSKIPSMTTLKCTMRATNRFHISDQKLVGIVLQYIY